jgi:hypothetical protein
MWPTFAIRGFRIHRNALDIGAQQRIVDLVPGIVKAGTFMRPIIKTIAVEEITA